MSAPEALVAVVPSEIKPEIMTNTQEEAKQEVSLVSDQIVPASSPVVADAPAVMKVNTDDVKPPVKGGKKEKPKKKKEVVPPREGYKVVCCGNSWTDLFLIPLCLIGLYIFLGGFYALIMHAIIQTTTTAAALWIYFFAWLTGVFFVLVMIKVYDYENCLKKKLLQETIPENTV